MKLSVRASNNLPLNIWVCFGFWLLALGVQWHEIGGGMKLAKLFFVLAFCMAGAMGAVDSAWAESAAPAQAQEQDDDSVIIAPPPTQTQDNVPLLNLLIQQQIETQRRLDALQNRMIEAETSNIDWWLNLILIILAAIAIWAALITIWATVYVGRSTIQIGKDKTESAESAKDAQAAAKFAEGNAKFEQKDLAGAIADYNEAIRLKPDFTEAYNNRGHAKLEQDDFREAIADFNEAIRLNPNEASTYNNRGSARKLQEDFDGAIADYNEAIRLKPNYTTAYFNRGNAKLISNNFNEAISNYDKALELARAQNMLATRIEIIESARKKAIEARDKANPENPDDSKT